MNVRQLSADARGQSNVTSQRGRRRPSWKVVVAAAAVLVTLLYLITAATKASAEYYLTVGQLRAKGTSAIGQVVRVGGRAASGSIQWNAATQTLSFTLTDSTGSLPVVYTGVVPDMFGYARDGHYQDAVVEGTLQPNGTFRASQIIVKHDARFAAAGAQATQAGTGKAQQP
ncbi:MAG: cytochrome c maturation protein CcmE [Chloroflexi bacterium]|nr:cytochrome c maturation protein CcmE [Chloroflexota bacterium]